VTDPSAVESQAVRLVQQLLDVCQGDLEVERAQVEHLKLALVSARRIGAAIGIVMAERKITDDDAFEALVHVSQHRNRKLRDLVEDVVLTGTLERIDD
jgi:AmiR/NasT family two-component response regulator